MEIITCSLCSRFKILQNKTNLFQSLAFYLQDKYLSVAEQGFWAEQKLNLHKACSVENLPAWHDVRNNFDPTRKRFRTSFQSSKWIFWTILKFLWNGAKLKLQMSSDRNNLASNKFRLMRFEFTSEIAHIPLSEICLELLIIFRITVQHASEVSSGHA